MGTSKVAGFTERCIFLPAGSKKIDTSPITSIGSYGCYWTSSLSSEEAYYADYFYYSASNVWVDDESNRCYGCSVRPVYDDRIHTESITLNKSSLFLLIGNNEQLIPTVLPAKATNKNVTWYSSNSNVATVDSDGVVSAVGVGSSIIKGRTVDGGFTATCTVSVESVPTPVDLGLPSGIKWASFNLGSSAPEGYGDYYAWGEIEPHYSSQNPLRWQNGKTGYRWATYKWCHGSYGSLTKYNSNNSHGIVDNKIVLEEADDVAHVKLGGSWHIPTDAELTELREQCTWTWIIQNGVNGYNITGPNDNSIFLPAAGDLGDTYIYNVGTYGDYWSSSLGMDYEDSSEYAYSLYFGSDDVSRREGSRYYGRSVRPVTE